jgi:metallophosphoesterase (TIGR00282 family)
MKIAFIGDIVGRAGRFMISHFLPNLIKTEKLDFVIGNYENASHGFGLTENNAKTLFSSGIDFMTGGNHTWDKKEIIPLFEKYPLIRPLNYPKKSAGNGWKIIEKQEINKKIAILNLMGHHNMPMVDNPFTRIDEVLSEVEQEKPNYIIIDFHSETTAEKRAMLFHLQNRVTALFGTHTHVATDDFQFFKNTFYITDIGLTGCYDSVIGMDSKSPLQKALFGYSSHHEVPKPNQCFKILQCVIADLENKTGYTLKVFENKEIIKREIIKFN